MVAHRTTRRSKLLGLTLAVGLVAAGCSSDSKGSTTTTPGTVDLVTATSEASDTTSVETTAASTPTSTDETSTSVAAAPTFPLTGLPLADPAAATRPALVVKIDNNPDARPQSGLNEADIVFEENVEQLTRFAAVFQSNGAEPVGPIRSGRTQDVDLLGSLNKPIFAWSGGNGRVTTAINSSDLVPVSETKAGAAMFRVKNRKAPHNLYGSVSALYDFAPPDAGPPPAQFQYRPGGVEAAGDGADAIKVSMDGIKVLWQWDPTTSTYLRFSDGKAHTDALDNAQVRTDNVVVLYVDYRPSPADEHSPEAQTEGFGVAWVFSAGKVVQGSWTRADRTQPFSLLDADGKPILLTPGHAFVELSRAGQGAIVPAGTDAAGVQYP
jgi:hypothetical protein